MSRIAELARIREGGTLRLRRAWPRGPHHLHLEYRTRDGDLIPGQWMDDVDELRRVARRTRRVSGLPVPVVEVDRGAICLQRGGADRRLTALAPLLRTSKVHLISHRPERRAVVFDGRRFGKVVREGHVERLARPLSALADTPVAVPEVDEIDEKNGILWQRAVAGCAPFDAEDPESAFLAIGRALRTLHDARPNRAMPGHASGDEAGLLATVLERTGAHDPELADALAAPIDAACARLVESLPSGSAAMLHRDLHDKQILVREDGSIVFIDLDTLALGERELDLANFAAHLELRGIQRHDDPEAYGAHRSAFVEGYGVDDIDPARLAAYVDATRLRLALVYAMRPRWRTHVAALRARVGHA